MAKDTQPVELTGSNAELINTLAIGTVAAGASVFLPTQNVAKYSRISICRISGDTSNTWEIRAYWRQSNSWNDLVTSSTSYTGGSVQVKSPNLLPYAKNTGASSADGGNIEVYGMVM